MNFKVDKIFITHHKPLKNRKKILTDYFGDRIDVEWIELYPPEEVSANYSRLVGSFTIDPAAKAVCQGQYTYYPNAGKMVTIPELSLYLKHKYAFEQQLEHNYNRILLLEDDALLPPDFDVFFNKCIAEFDQLDADLLFLGSCCDIHVENINKDRMVYLNENQLTRCAHAYVVDIRCTRKILEHLHPINWPIDFKLNEIIVIEKLKVCWSEPCIYQNRTFETTIQHQSILKKITNKIRNSISFISRW